MQVPLFIVLYNISDNYIEGKEFIRLSKDDVEKLIPPVGVTNRIMRLQPGGARSSDGGADDGGSLKTVKFI